MSAPMKRCLSPPDHEHEPTSFLLHQSSLSLFQDMSDLDTDTDTDDDKVALVTQVATSSRTPSPATNSSDTDTDTEADSTPLFHSGSPSFSSPTYEFPTRSFTASSLRPHMVKRRRLAGGKKSVQFDLSANMEYRSGSTLHLIGRQDPSALLRNPFKPASILVRRPGDIPSPAHLPLSQGSQTSTFSQPFLFFMGDRVSPSTTPSPSPELQLSPMISHSSDHEPSLSTSSSSSLAVSAAASAMAQSLGALFSTPNSMALQPVAFTHSVELKGELYSVPTESFSLPLPSHSTLFDELGSSSDQEQDDGTDLGVTAQKRSTSGHSSPPKRLRTDPSARRRGTLHGTSSTGEPSSSPRRLPAMLRREASYGSCIQRSSNSSSLDLTAFFDGLQSQKRQQSPLRNEIAQDMTPSSEDHPMKL